jgi:hypothetical protein
MMTKKDYQLIANVLRQAIDNTTDQTPRNAVIDVIVDSFVDQLFNDNQRFDPQKFYDAVGV